LWPPQSCRRKAAFDAIRQPPPPSVTLPLVCAPLVGWKIADIQTQRLPSLKAWLAPRSRARASG
jgi:hypothetical protein